MQTVKEFFCWVKVVRTGTPPDDRPWREETAERLPESMGQAPGPVDGPPAGPSPSADLAATRGTVIPPRLQHLFDAAVDSAMWLPPTVVATGPVTPPVPRPSPTPRPGRPRGGSGFTFSGDAGEEFTESTGASEVRPAERLFAGAVMLGSWQFEALPATERQHLLQVLPVLGNRSDALEWLASSDGRAFCTDADGLWLASFAVAADL